MTTTESRDVRIWILTRSMQYSCHFTEDKCKSNESRGEKTLKELLCHPNHGLAVYIAFNKFIVLKSSETDLEHFIEDCLNLKLQDTADLCVVCSDESRIRCVYFMIEKIVILSSPE